jgi:hypothetical protein
MISPTKIYFEIFLLQNRVTENMCGCATQSYYMSMESTSNTIWMSIMLHTRVLSKWLEISQFSAKRKLTRQ